MCREWEQGEVHLQVHPITLFHPICHTLKSYFQPVVGKKNSAKSWSPQGTCISQRTEGLKNPHRAIFWRQASIRRDDRLSLQEMPSGTSPIPTSQVQSTAGIQTPLYPGSCCYSKAVLQCPTGRQPSDGPQPASCSWLPGTVFLSAKQETSHCLLFFFFFGQLTKKILCYYIRKANFAFLLQWNNNAAYCIVPVFPPLTQHELPTVWDTNWTKRKYSKCFLPWFHSKYYSTSPHLFTA